MSTRDFSSVSTGRGEESNSVADQIRQSMSRKGQQATATDEEAAERASALKTQGRKGCKAVRINMAFTPENHDFIKVLARANCLTMTEFTNAVIDVYRREHSKQYEKVKALQKECQVEREL